MTDGAQSDNLLSNAGLEKSRGRQTIESYADPISPPGSHASQGPYEPQGDTKRMFGSFAWVHYH